jgi:hypothetical protein
VTPVTAGGHLASLREDWRALRVGSHPDRAQMAQIEIEANAIKALVDGGLDVEVIEAPARVTT